ncbi:MAG: MFS transporter [Gammaproteobacteria bacterium]|nr:MFS transporter [Gammaproteobacteria bacterium]
MLRSVSGDAMNPRAFLVAPLAALPVRFRILGLLFVLSFVNYLLRNNLSVAQPTLSHEYSLSATQFGFIYLAFNVAYTLFQIPSGVLSDRYGPRLLLAGAAIAWGVLTALTGILPGLFPAITGTLVALIAIRALMGVANAPMFPVAAGAFARWFPVGQWALPNSVLSSGLTLGQAAVGPVVAFLIVTFSWQASFLLLAPIGVLAGLWWWSYGRDDPREHRAVSAAERELIATGRAPAAPAEPGAWRVVLRNRNVLLLAASYFSMNYTFYIFSNWLYTYLVEERGFGLLAAGFLYALPFVVGAVLAAAGGAVCDFLCRRVGLLWGCRLPAIVGLLMAAWLLLAGAAAPNAYVAVALLSLCFGFTQFTEGAFWQGTTAAAGPHTATATGVLNTGGNLVGFLAPLVGFIVDSFGWWAAFVTGSAFALAAVVLWLVVRFDPIPVREPA